MLPSFFSRSMSINNRKKWIANSCDAWHRARDYGPLPRMGECTASHLHEPLGKLNSLLLHELRVPIPLVEPESALLVRRHRSEMLSGGNTAAATYRDPFLRFPGGMKRRLLRVKRNINGLLETRGEQLHPRSKHRRLAEVGRHVVMRGRPKHLADQLLHHKSVFPLLQATRVSWSLAHSDGQYQMAVPGCAASAARARTAQETTLLPACSVFAAPPGRI